MSPYFAAVAGKGIGQLVALALDGAIALDDACLLALERGLHLGEYDTFETLLNLRFQDRPGLIRAPQRAPIADGVRGDGNGEGVGVAAHCTQPVHSRRRHLLLLHGAGSDEPRVGHEA